MPETVMPAAGSKTSSMSIRAVSDSSAKFRAFREAPSQSQVTPLARRMTSPLVRVLDQVVLITAVLVSLFSSSLQRDETFNHFLQLRISMRNLLLMATMMVVWRFLFWVAGMYQPRLNPSIATMLWRAPLTAFLCTAILFPLLLWVRPPEVALRSSIVFYLFTAALMVTSRMAVFTYEQQVRPAFRRRRTVLICGTGIRARSVVMQLPSHPDFKYQLAGFIDSKMQSACSRFGNLLGTVEELEAILMREPIDEVIVALPVKSHFSAIEQIVNVCGRAGIQTQYSLLNFTSEFAKHHTFEDVEGTRVVLQMVHNDHRLKIKNALDRIVATVGLIVLAPLLLLIALAIKLTSRGPAFFVQQRFGLGKRTFGMIKFRSMVIDAEARIKDLEALNESEGPTFKMKRDPRITRIGAILRRTSLDELPQLINVVKGDMSLIGPRPLPLRDVEKFSEPWLMRRFSVKPGITGLWQVSGRSDTAFSNAINLDLRYIDHWSLLMDLKILLKTFSAVIKGSGAY